MAAIATPSPVGHRSEMLEHDPESRAPCLASNDAQNRVMTMQSPREILTEIWTSTGGDAAALEAVRLTGEEPQLPSSFRVAAAAQVSIAASGLAAAEIWKMRRGAAQNVAVDMRHAAVECRSERYLRVAGKPPPPAWDAIAGVYKTG